MPVMAFFNNAVERRPAWTLLALQRFTFTGAPVAASGNATDDRADRGNDIGDTRLGRHHFRMLHAQPNSSTGTLVS